MRRLSAAAAVGFAAFALVLASAQGSPVAKKTATVPVPADGNATVAHLVLQATAKKGKKKSKKPVRRPRLKIQKAPQGVVVAASYKRDAKNKNRWHATVVVTNPVNAPLRITAASGRRAQEGDVVLIIETDDAYIIVFGQLQIEEDVTYQEMPVPTWMGRYCDPPGSSGDRFLFGQPPAGVPATEFLDYGCILGSDGPTTGEQFEELGLAGLVGELDPFPGNPNEYYLDFVFVNIEGANVAAFQFPGHNVVAQLPPSGFTGVISPGTASWGKRDTPFVEGQEYRGNVRLDSPLRPVPMEIPRALYSETYAPPYSNPYPITGP